MFQTPTETVLLDELRAATVAFGTMPSAYHSDGTPDELQWTHGLYCAWIRYREALRDIREHLIIEGEIETDRGTWKIGPDGREVFVWKREEAA